MAEALATRYRVILPDLRGHGESGVGEGPATMEKHAADIARVMDDADVGRAPLIGVSIGGYVLFEFWRKHRGRVAALGLCNTKAPADTSRSPRRTPAGRQRRSRARHRTVFRIHDSEVAGQDAPAKRVPTWSTARSA